ncbi:hypothetical protein L7F22_046167 [Adiantum nelumboides]|nr:hypothetical protein [Adiantum nelumboides]
MDSGGGKRAVDRASHGNKPRRRLSGAVIAAIEREMLHRLETNIEPMIRRVVVEETDRAFTRFAMQHLRFPHRQLSTGASTSGASRPFHLDFISSPAVLSTYTGTKLDGKCGDTIRVRLVNVVTRQLVTEGPESAAELEVVPLMGEFDTPDDQDWPADEFERYVAKERDGKAPLLVGELKVYLKGGLATLGHLTFTDNSSWTRSKKFRLGVRAVHINGPGLASIREGKSEAFLVKEGRGRVNQKHEIPSPNDEVWRLRHIAKDGSSYRNLAAEGIHTVKEFLHWVHERPEDLKKVLNRMPAKAYEEAVAQAKKGILGDRMYVCPVNQPLCQEVILSQDFQPVGAVAAQGDYVHLDELNDIQKVQMDDCFKIAFKNLQTNAAELEVGVDVANEDELFDIASTGTAADGLSTDEVHNMVPLPLHIQAPSHENLLNDIAMAAEPSYNLEPIPVWEQSNSGLVIDSLWEYYDSGGTHPNADVDIEELSSSGVTIHTKQVLSEEYGGYGDICAGDPRVHASALPTSKWWLRIRAGVRCALFIRNVGQQQQQQQPPHYHSM